MTLKIRQRLNNLRYLDGGKRLTVRTSSNIYSVLFSTSPYRPDTGEWAINLFTVFAETFESFDWGWNAVDVGVVILNRSFLLTLSCTIRD